MVLFISDGFNGIQTGCLLGRVPAEEEACGCADHETEEHAPRLYQDGPVGEDVDAPGSAQAAQDADDAARDA